MTLKRERRVMSDDLPNLTGAAARTGLVLVGGVSLVGGMLGAGFTLLETLLSSTVIDPIELFVSSLGAIFLGISTVAVGVSIPGTYGTLSVPSFELSPARRRYALAGGFLLGGSGLTLVVVVLVDTGALFFGRDIPPMVLFIFIALLFGGIFEILTGFGLITTALGTPYLKERAPLRIPPAETFDRYFEDVAERNPRLTLGVRRVLALVAGGVIVVGILIFVGSWMLLSNASDDPNLGMVVVVWMYGSVFLTLGAVGLFTFVSTAPGPGQLLLGSPPHVERHLVQIGGVMLMVGPLALVLQFVVPGVGFLGSLTSLGLKLVVLGSVLRAGTLVHRRLRTPPGGSEESATVRQ